MGHSGGVPGSGSFRPHSCQTSSNIRLRDDDMDRYRPPECLRKKNTRLISECSASTVSEPVSEQTDSKAQRTGGPGLPPRLRLQRVVRQRLSVEVQRFGVLQQLDAVSLRSNPRTGIFSLCPTNGSDQHRTPAAVKPVTADSRLLLVEFPESE